MKDAARWIAIAALFLVPLLPLYVANDMFFPFITGKGFAFRILVEIAAVAYIVLAIADKKYRPRFSWTLVVFGAFTAWMFIADILAINAHKALWSNLERMDGWITLIHLFLFFVVAGSVLSVGNLWRKWWLTFIGVAAFVCGHGLMQLLCAGQACGASGAVFAIHQSTARLDASLGNATYLAVYLLFAIAVTLWQAFESRGRMRYVLGALALIEIVVLFNTATRGAVIGLIAAALVCAFLWLVRSGKRARGVAAGAVIGLLVLIGGFWLARDASVIRESPVFSRIASISLAEGQTRFTLWRMAGEAIAERPLIGYGQEGFNYVFNEHYRPSLFAQEPWFDRAHNVFVDWLVAGGIPGLLLFVGLLGAGVLALLRAPISRPESIFLTGAIVAYAFQALFVFDNLFSYVPLAAVLAMAHAASARPVRVLERLPEAKGGQAQAIIAPIACVVALLLVFIVNVSNMSAASNLVYAISPLPGGPAENLARFKAALEDEPFATQEIREQLINYSAQVVTQPNIPETLRAEFVTLALAEMGKEIKRAPDDARLYIEMALLYRTIGDYENALAAVRVAERLSPKRQNFLLEHGTILMAAGKYEEARDVYRAAYELDPQFPDLAAYAASGYFLTGEDGKADALLLEHFGTTTVDHPALVRAYYESKRYDDLIRILRFSVERAGSTAAARYRLATAYALAGRYREARMEAQAAMARYPETQAQGQAFLGSLP
ncbi:MAG: O-antigen ligase family protein [Patescibacteria group bacterium]